MSNLTDFIGAVVKSVQRGETSFSYNATPFTENITISSINLNKAVAFANVNVHGVGFSAHLTSATNLRIRGMGDADGSYPGYISWQVIEFY